MDLRRGKKYWSLHVEDGVGALDGLSAGAYRTEVEDRYCLFERVEPLEVSLVPGETTKVVVPLLPRGR